MRYAMNQWKFYKLIAIVVGLSSFVCAENRRTTLLVLEKTDQKPVFVFEADGKARQHITNTNSATSPPAGALVIEHINGTRVWMDDAVESQVHFPGNISEVDRSIGLQPGLIFEQAARGEMFQLDEAGTFRVFNSNIENDIDGDALPDTWETDGYGGIDLPGMGVDPFRKDVLVEVDWMVHPQFSQKLVDEGALKDVLAAFDVSTSNNPNGQPGINLIVDYGQGGLFTGGNEVPLDDDLNPVWTEFNALRDVHFATDRRPIFRYCIFGMKYDGGSSSGKAQINGQYFMVTIGSWAQWNNRQYQAGTFMHELGHNLGLLHSGSGASVDNRNYKPNYLSVMNYMFQFSGLDKLGNVGVIDYSRFYLGDLDENNLNEPEGVSIAIGNPEADSLDLYNNYGTKWDRGGEVSHRLALSIDWNKNATLENGIARDINGDVVTNVLKGSVDDWQNLAFGSGGIGREPLSGGNTASEDDADFESPEELTEEDVIEMLEF